jgi:hypothetical protein
MYQAVSRRLLTGFNPRLVHVGFVVNKVVIGQCFSVYFAFPCQYHSNKANIYVARIIRTNGRNLEIFQKATSPRNFGKI